MKRFLIILLFLGSPAVAEDLIVVGRTEKVQILGSELILHATLAPSFRYSRINASDIDLKTKKGRARFTISDRYGKNKRFDMQLEADSDKPTVVFEFCLAGRKIPEQVLLTDRSDKDTDLLLGREALAGQVVINPATAFRLDPACE